MKPLFKIGAAGGITKVYMVLSVTLNQCKLTDRVTECNRRTSRYVYHHCGGLV